jgi:hypothetical protein
MAKINKDTSNRQHGIGGWLTFIRNPLFYGIGFRLVCFVILVADLTPSNEASYNIVKRGTKNAEERVYTGTDYQQTQGS